MNRNIAKAAAVVLGSLVLAGCASSTYDPNTDDKHLAAYAAQAAYPDKVQPEMGVHLFCVVEPNMTITLYNAGDESFSDLELWVNKLYTLHVTKLAPRSRASFAGKDMFDQAADDLGKESPNNVHSVQIYVRSTGKLIDVQGPIVPH